MLTNLGKSCSLDLVFIPSIVCELYCYFFRSLLQFAKENDQLVASIAERGYSFIKKHLKMKHILCYWKTLLLKYSKLLVYDVKKHEDVKLL